jgi:hypothetical protein
VLTGLKNGTGTAVDLGDGTLYSYLFAKYDGLNAGSEVWYVGNLSGIIDIPAFWGQNALSDWTLFRGEGTPPAGSGRRRRSDVARPGLRRAWHGTALPNELASLKSFPTQESGRSLNGHFFVLYRRKKSKLIPHASPLSYRLPTACPPSFAPSAVSEKVVGTPYKPVRIVYTSYYERPDAAGLRHFAND